MVAPADLHITEHWTAGVGGGLRSLRALLCYYKKPVCVVVKAPACVYMSC